jgi:diphthamide synthase subunit DPH2
MTIAARLQTSSAADRRSWPRYELRLDASLRASGAKVTIHNLSSTGMLIETRAALCSFDSLEVDLPEVGITRAFVVWSSGRFHGCKFKLPLSKSTISAALLRGELLSTTSVTGSRRTRWSLIKRMGTAFRLTR